MTRVTYDSGFDDLEDLRKRFEEFRNQHETRTRLPEELWQTAAEIAERRGMNLVCRCLRLDANSLKNWMGKGVSEPKRKYITREERVRRCRRRPYRNGWKLFGPPAAQVVHHGFANPSQRDVPYGEFAAGTPSAISLYFSFPFEAVFQKKTRTPRTSSAS